jgi:hypothetical protein
LTGLEVDALDSKLLAARDVAGFLKAGAFLGDAGVMAGIIFRTENGSEELEAGNVDFCACNLVRLALASVCCWSTENNSLPVFLGLPRFLEAFIKSVISDENN